MINLPNILHNETPFSAFPNHLAGKYEPTTVIYTLSNTIHSTLFNFNKFVKDLNLEAFNDDNSILVNVKVQSLKMHIINTLLVVMLKV